MLTGKESKILICHWGKHLSTGGTTKGQHISAVQELQWHFKPHDTTLMQIMIVIITILGIREQTEKENLHAVSEQNQD